MAITNLGTLQTAVETWLGGRTIPDSLFLEFATEITGILHTGMRDDEDRTWVVPPLRSRLMETSSTLSVSGAQASLPADWLEFSRLWIDTNSGRPLRYLPLNEFWQDYRVQASDEPEVYTIDGTTMHFAPTSDATVQISYFQELDALAADEDTNVILTDAPHIYRRGCLWLALDWEGPDSEGPNLRTANELRGFASVVKAVNAERNKAQRGGSLLVQRPVRSVV
jgi:hypothetical protein